MNRRYRIQTVSEMTGVPAPTLRAWERRYGVPNPQRSASAYRLYSEADVDMIRRLKELTEAGMSPVEAARMVSTLEGSRGEGTDSSDPWKAARDRIVQVVSRFDGPALQDEIRAALFLGPAVQIVDRVLTPALQQIGEEWLAGRITVAQEHLGSELIGNAMRDLLRLLAPEAPARTAVLACFADETHVLALYAVGFHLVRWGYRPEILGGRLPPEALSYAVSRLQPDLVGLSVTMKPEPRRAAALLRGYAEACGDVPWIVGGAAAGHLRERVEGAGGAIYEGFDATTLHGLVDGLVRGS